MMQTLIASLTFMGVPLVLYVCQGWIVYYRGKRFGMFLAMMGYAIANVGLILDAMGI